MTPSDLCIEWIKHSEGCTLIAKNDNGKCSIGYGHRGVPEGTVWTQGQAEIALKNDIAFAAQAVSRMVYVSLSQGQFDALVDFTFNLGAGDLYSSTLLDLLNQGKYDDVPAQLMRWDHIGQTVSPGLQARRTGDVILWNGGNPLESA